MNMRELVADLEASGAAVVIPDDARDLSRPEVTERLATLAIERYAFDPTTHAGAFDTRLSRGTLSVVSGKIAKQTPGAMTVKTPAAILGVRSTEFVVRADDGIR